MAAAVDSGWALSWARPSPANSDAVARHHSSPLSVAAFSTVSERSSNGPSSGRGTARRTARRIRANHSLRARSAWSRTRLRSGAGSAPRSSQSAIARPAVAMSPTNPAAGSPQVPPRSRVARGASPSSSAARPAATPASGPMMRAHASRTADGSARKARRRSESQSPSRTGRSAGSIQCCSCSPSRRASRPAAPPDERSSMLRNARHAISGRPSRSSRRA